jgi:CRP/FNR family transcriptional regulator, cyclic AMP receptor protein
MLRFIREGMTLTTDREQGMLHTRVQILQEMPIFGGTEQSTIQALLEGASIREFARGDTVFQEGELDTSIYVIERGRVSVFRHWQGDNYKLRELAEGDCFGEMALMDFKPRSATVIADTDCSLIQISAAQLGELYGKAPEQYTLILMNLGREVCRRLREADKRLFLMEVNESPS